ncbi:OmpH family outer membrane protein [Sandaracinomonas limnophila]|uniref:OmpH family outer membrane protein n=1 Tax=Sandaracinomonas limnophila TaxID=1862386 RepID=A0A437PTF7_9BACT|nr:OmpH family outer membrane protein [Sandaracinomonas limnophila]RVU25510.1 OmpH family outer membrane protein [Sandaracinomonas limnophila]
MKNLPLIWCAVLTLVVGFLIYKQNGGSSSGAGIVAANGKHIVFVNTDSLLTKYDFYKDAQKEFENKGYRLQVDLGQKERSLQGEVAAIQQRASAMTQAELQAADLTLKKKGAELQQYSQQKQAELGQEQAKKNEELYNNIREYIKKINKDNKFEFVLGYSRIGGGILFADESVDVTEKILDGLNKEYAAKKSGK